MNSTTMLVLSVLAWIGLKASTFEIASLGAKLLEDRAEIIHDAENVSDYRKSMRHIAACILASLILVMIGRIAAIVLSVWSVIWIARGI